VNTLPGVASAYRWKGRIERADEALLVIKTTASALAGCRRALAAVHPYDVPEVVVVTPAAIEARYAAWVRASTG
jgi:periplasmic divalent cation tolerance protein